MGGRSIATAGALLALALWLAAPATAAPRGESAGDFAVSIVWNNLRDQYGQLWAKLHPRHRAVTNRDFWEACQSKLEAADTYEFLSVKAIEEYPDTVRVPILGRVKVTAVTIEGKVDAPLIGKRTVAGTRYVGRFGDHWYGFWDQATYRAYAAHRCPAK